MGRSFSFGRAWDRNERHRKILDLAQQMSEEQGTGDPMTDMPLLEGEVKRRQREVRDPETGEVTQSWSGFEDYPGGLDGAHGDMTHEGRPIIVTGRRFDSKSGRMEIDFVPETQDGKLGGSHRYVIERTGEGQWRSLSTRRIYS
jgi:hypothetical protein